MFSSESKSMSTHIMLKELKGLGLNNCGAFRKPLFSEATQKKVWKSKLRSPEWWTHQGEKRSRWSDYSPFYVHKMRSADYLNMLNDQVWTSVDLFFLDKRHFTRWRCQESFVQIVKEFSSWNGPHRVQCASTTSWLRWHETPPLDYFKYIT